MLMPPFADQWTNKTTCDTFVWPFVCPPHTNIAPQHYYGIFPYTVAGLAQLGLAQHISPARQGSAFPLQQGHPLVGAHSTEDAPR